jgi:hypothetical protein
MQNANLHMFPTSHLTGYSNTRISEDVKAYILSQFSSLKSKFPNYFTDASVTILVFTTNSFSGVLVADLLSGVLVADPLSGVLVADPLSGVLVADLLSGVLVANPLSTQGKKQFIFHIFRCKNFLQ